MPGAARRDPNSTPALIRDAFGGSEAAAAILARRSLETSSEFVAFWRMLPGGRMTPDLFRMFDRAWTTAHGEYVRAGFDTVEVPVVPTR